MPNFSTIKTAPAVSGAKALTAARRLLSAAAGRVVGMGARSKPLRRGSGVRGRVDGFIGGELRGWVVDLDDPARLPRIRCVGVDGRSLDVTPTCRREDVCRAFGIDGARGFAVPADLLAALGPTISVRDERDAVIVGGAKLRARGAVATSPGQNRQWLFMHIPKTAGSSLREALLRSCSPGEILHVYPDGDLGLSYEECLSMSPAQRERFRWIYGHFKTGLHLHAAPGARYVTFLREPLARLRSNVAHHAAAGTRFTVSGHEVRPSVFINEGLGEEFDNLVTRMISGILPGKDGPGAVGLDHVELAIDNVRRHFAFVGQQEYLERDSAELQARLGLPSAIPARVNVTPARSLYPPTELDAIDWTELGHRNRFDVLLHRRLIDLALTSRLLGE